jgi:hypothetical protein
MVVRDQPERAAVRLRLDHGRGPGDAAGAGQVLDHHRLAKGLAQGRTGRARDGVHAGAGADRQDQAHRLAGAALRERADAGRGQRGGHGGGQRQP